MLYILEFKEFEDSDWAPYENGCIISDHPWHGLIKRIEATGGWGTRWRAIPDNEAIAYLVERASSKSTEPDSIITSLASLIGDAALEAAFIKTALTPLPEHVAA